MKTNLIILIVFLIFTASCKGRNPNLSDKQLAELITNEAKQAEAKAEEQSGLVSPDGIYTPPVGIKYSENRAVNPAHPPVTLKVALPTGEKRALKLSDFGSSVEYVTLTLPNESDFFLSSAKVTGHNWFAEGQRTIAQKAGDFFISIDALAIRLFDKQGKFIKNIAQAEAEEPYTIEEINLKTEVRFQDVFNNRCSFTKTADNEFQRCEYNLLTGQLTTTHIKSISSFWGTNSYVDENTLLCYTRFFQASKPFFTTNIQGDTLCKFANHVKFPEAFKNKNIAGSDRSFLYRTSDNQLFFRMEYCDTVFQVESASRIVPAFCFDFGTKRTSIEEGLAGKTEGKLLPWKLIDYKDKLILLFTEGRDCPNCRSNNQVKFFCVQYNKNTGKETFLDIGAKYPESTMIKNDIDGGLPLPLTFMQISESSITVSYTKKQLLNALENNPISGAKAEELKAKANAMKQNELLMIIVK